MLGGNDDGVDALHAAVLAVLHGDLTLAVRAQPVELAGLAHGRQLHGKLLGIGDGSGHQLGRFAAGEAEHHALIARAEGVGIVKGAVHAHGDIAGLLVDGSEHSAGMAVEAGLRLIIADAADGIAGHMGDVHIALRGDFAHDHDHAGRGAAFTGDARLGVLRQNSVEHAVGDLIADLVRMPLGHGFGGKDSFLHLEVPSSLIFLYASNLLDTKKRPAVDRAQGFCPHLSIKSLELAPCKCRLSGFIGPVPPPLSIRLLHCVTIIAEFRKKSTGFQDFFRTPQVSDTIKRGRS